VFTLTGAEKEINCEENILVFRFFGWKAAQKFT